MATEVLEKEEKKKPDIANRLEERIPRRRENCGKEERYCKRR